jgi:hypothetical protein
MPKLDELPIETVAAGASLVAEVQQMLITTQFLGKLADMIGTVGDGAPVPYFAGSFSMRDCHRDRRLMDIKPNKYGILHLVSLLSMRLGVSPPDATPLRENAAGEATDPINSHRDHRVWDHLRTSNPIESVFATVRHRTVRTKGALSQDTARLMVFKLVTAAAKTWRRLKGENQLPKVVQGVTFTNGVEVTNTPAQNAA